MPINIQNEINQNSLCSCQKCDSLFSYDKKTAIPGYEYGCKYLEKTAFNVIPNEVVQNGSIFMDCPKLEGTIAEGVRYKAHVIKQ